METFEVSSVAIDAFVADYAYKILVGLTFLGILVCFFLRMNAAKIKKMAALAFIVILSFKIT